MNISNSPPETGAMFSILDDKGNTISATTEDGYFIYDWYGGKYNLRIMTDDTKKLEALSIIREQPFFI